uniref:Uncharacterized protein n=1 Tax=Porterella carnosula TaxID=101774 RepID=A0A1L6BVQ6_9ASTR|nr:hypothetical protein Po_car1Pt0598 [Porterella carnosula]APQ40095.1 hypothetical protein Po_car1Pt0598 [Porterella carnosula]
MHKNRANMDGNILRLFLELKTNSYLARLYLRYLLRWGLEKNSLSHRIALTYLFNNGFRTNSLVDRLALTYVLHGGLKKNSLVARLVRAYLVKRGLAKHSLFNTMARAFSDLLKKGDQTKNLLETMAFMYLVKRCNDAVDKGLSVNGLGDVFDLAQVEGIHLIDQNFEVLSKTRMAWQTAKTAVHFRSIRAFYQETSDEFRDTAEMGYWTGALERLRQLEQEETECD